MDGFCRKKVWAGELLTKEKKELVLDQDRFCGERNSKGFTLQIVSSFPEGWTDRAHATDYLIGVDQKVPDSLVGITFLGKVKTEVRPGIKLRFSTWALAHVMPFWANN